MGQRPWECGSLLLAFLALCSLSRAQDVVVESADAAAKKSRDSAALLRPPSSSKDSYASTVDWRNVPPWRQTSFCGVRAHGTFFVFVVDCSGSMSEAERWLQARHELRRTLARLQFPQRYYVIFYNDRAWPMPGGLPQSAGKRAMNRTLDWISRVVPEGDTDPRGAMSEALALRPHAVFLLSDGEYPEGSVEAIREANTGKVPIHCIDMSGGAAGDALKLIAKESGGEYAARGTTSE